MPPRLLRPPASCPHPSAVCGAPSPSTFLPTGAPTDAARPTHRDCRKSVGATVTRHGLQSEASTQPSGSWAARPRCAEAGPRDCSQKAPAPLTLHPAELPPALSISSASGPCVHTLGAIADLGSPDSATPASFQPVLPNTAPVEVSGLCRPTLCPPTPAPEPSPLNSQIMDQMSGLKSHVKSNVSPPFPCTPTARIQHHQGSTSTLKGEKRKAAGPPEH